MNAADAKLPASSPMMMQQQSAFNSSSVGQQVDNVIRLVLSQEGGDEVRSGTGRGRLGCNPRTAVLKRSLWVGV